MEKKDAKLKSLKKVVVRAMSMLTAATISLLATVGCAINDEEKVQDTHPIREKVTTQETVPTEKEICYKKLEYLRQQKLPTTTQTFNGKQYQVAEEKHIVELSHRFAKAIEDYFKECGASDWTNPYSGEFWPEDIEFIVTAIAFRESTYRTDVMNDIGCGGLTGINKEQLLDTLGNQWLTSRVWGENVPQVNCNPSEVDILNGTTSIEYTYYNIGYNLANRFKKDKYFIDTDGTKRSVWEKIEFTEEKQIRLIIASHLFGVNNVVDSVFGRNYDKDGKLIPIRDYMYSDYVEDVMDKMVELEILYGEAYIR